MDKRQYFAVFDPSEEDEGGFTVTFPDLPGAITEGNDFDEARRNAQECLELHLYGMERDGDDIPVSSLPRDIQTPSGAFLVPVEAWMDLIRNEMANKSVNKMVTLPRWLKEAADQQHINYSQLLQHAIKQRLNIHENHPD